MIDKITELYLRINQNHYIEKSKFTNVIITFQCVQNGTINQLAKHLLLDCCSNDIQVK